MERNLGWKACSLVWLRIYRRVLKSRYIEGNYDLLYMNQVTTTQCVEVLEMSVEDIKLWCERKLDLFRGFKMSLQSEILKTWSRGN